MGKLYFSKTSTFPSKPQQKIESNAECKLNKTNYQDFYLFVCLFLLLGRPYWLINILKNYVLVKTRLI